jgi:two-component system LytT family response regulator
MDGPVHHLLVRARRRVSLLAPPEIDWIQAQGDYVCIASAGKRFLHREKISRLEQLLPLHLFVRIHRSCIVNIDRILEMRPRLSGDYDIFLRDGTRLALSRSYRQKVLHQLMNAA